MPEKGKNPNVDPPEDLFAHGLGATPDDEPSRASPDSTRPTGSDEEINPSDIRLPSDFGEIANVKKLITTVPVRKPAASAFVRTRPGENWRLPVGVIELKDQGELYVVSGKLMSQLGGEVSPRLLFTAIDRQGVVFLWPVKLPKGERRTDKWSASAMEAAELAQERWIRLRANMALGAYEVFEAQGQLPDPEWPEVSFFQLLQIAFRGRMIESLDHPVLRELRGEI